MFRSPYGTVIWSNSGFAAAAAPAKLAATAPKTAVATRLQSLLEEFIVFMFISWEFTRGRIGCLTHTDTVRRQNPTSGLPIAWHTPCGSDNFSGTGRDKRQGIRCI